MEIEKEEIDISGLDKATLLAALYNSARRQGIGAYFPADGNMSNENAQQIIDARQGEERPRDRTYFDYLNGRVMKVDLSGDVLRTALYNRDNGPGLAQAIVATLRKAEKATS